MVLDETVGGQNIYIDYINVMVMIRIPQNLDPI